MTCHANISECSTSYQLTVAHIQCRNTATDCAGLWYIFLCKVWMWKSIFSTLSNSVFKAFTQHNWTLMNIIKCCFLGVLTSLINLIKPYSALLVTSHWALHRKDNLCRLCAGSASAERVGQGEVDRSQRVTFTWWLLGLSLKRQWLVPGGPPPTLTAWTGLETLCSPCRGWFLARKATLALNRCMVNDSANYCMLVNEWVWFKSWICLLRLEEDMSSVLESELGQKWR